MTPAIILTTPAGTPQDFDALRREFGVVVIFHNWHPSVHAAPGVLHLTCMHPDDLRDAGCHEFIERGWQAQPLAAAHRQRGISTICANVCLALFLSTCAAFVGPLLDDTEAAQDVADDLQQVPASVAAQQRKEQAEQLMCGGPEATRVPQADGHIRCKDKHGRTTTTLPTHRGAA